MKTTLVLGGARSGKSGYAERLALSRTESPVYLATSRIWDEDHHKRIKRHQQDRGPEWTNIEEEKALSAHHLHERVVVVDCITLWLTNFFIDNKSDPEKSLTEAKAEMQRTLQQNCEWIFVSNEVGLSLHANTESGRKFTDLQGFFNQFLAARVDNVVLMVAGIPLQIKGEAAQLPSPA